jgi:membrane fusion protein, heavy metal efflux system
MIVQDKRLLGGVAAAVLVAAAGGFTIARYTADTPAAPAAEAAAKPGEADTEAAPGDTLEMSAEMLKNTGVTTETVNPGG